MVVNPKLWSMWQHLLLIPEILRVTHVGKFKSPPLQGGQSWNLISKRPVPLNILIFNILRFSVISTGFWPSISGFSARSCAKAKISLRSGLAGRVRPSLRVLLLACCAKRTLNCNLGWGWYLIKLTFRSDIRVYAWRCFYYKRYLFPSNLAKKELCAIVSISSILELLYNLIRDMEFMISYRQLSMICRPVQSNVGRSGWSEWGLRQSCYRF